MQDGRRKRLSSDTDATKGIQLWECEISEKTEYELIINGVFIMASYNALSSELLIRNAVKVSHVQKGQLLIGGLGLGYSVKEATKHDCLTEIDVVEIDANVIHYNCVTLEHVNGVYLKDHRVTIIHNDFIYYVRSIHKQYDIICMDIDNGPMLITNAQNTEAYSHKFFCDIFHLLNSEGCFVVWSCEKDNTILDFMNSIFSSAFIQEVFEIHNGKSIPYYLYLACK